jgi:type IV pilus assembly protein PilP
MQSEYKNSKKNKKLYGIAGLLLVAIYAVGVTGSEAAVDNKNKEESDSTLSFPAIDAEETATTFEYIMEGRPDPFVPFITEKVVTKVLDLDEIVDDENMKLTGMRQFEPGQLTLVAILKGDRRGGVAMVEDVTGRGYMLSEGIPIGRRGVVAEITSRKVLIVETARTRAGKEIKNTIVMRLNKEGE